MNEISNVYVDRPQLTLLDKAANWLAWGLSIALFWNLGWMAMAPDDPLGAVSLLTHPRPVAMWLQSAGLAMVAAAVGALLAGRRIVGAGTFAAGLGLTAVSLRGGTMAYMVIGEGGNLVDMSALARSMAFESAQWVLVMLLAMMISGWTSRWCSANVKQASDPTADGMKHLGITAIASFLAVYLLSPGLTHRAIAHGQSCFVAAAAAMIGSYVAHRVAPVSRTRWSVFGVALMSMAGYLWASLRPTVPGLPPGIPGNPFLRILPIQMVSLSVAGAIAMFWYVTHAHTPHDETVDVRGAAE